MLLSLPLFTKGVLLFALALFLVGVFLAVLIPIARSVGALLSTTPVVHIEAAKIGDDDVSAYLPMRARELGTGVRLDALYEIRVPPLAENFGSGEKFKLPEGLKFEVQGIDVSGIVSSILKLLPEHRYTIKVEPAKGTDTVRVEWKSPDGTSKTWPLRSEQTDPAGSKRLADRVIANVLYYMYYDPDGPKAPRPKPTVAGALSAPEFPNARALEAYFSGQQYLNAYLRNTDDPTPLANAETEFRRLQKEMPGFIDGVMLLGITLSEKRAEADAVIAYDHAKDLIRMRIKEYEGEIAKLKTDAQSLLPEQRADNQARIAARTAARVAARKTLFQAHLFQANAYRKLYNWRDLVRAMTELDEADAQLAALEQPAVGKAPDQDQLEFAKIRAVVLAEKASVVGYGLILLYPETFVGELKCLTAPRTLAVDYKRRKELKVLAEELETPNNAVITKRNEAFKRELQRLADTQSHVLDQAREAVAAIRMPTDAKSADQEAWERERNRLESLLLSAEGYGMFRLAQLVEPDDEKGNEKFVERAEAALKKLHAAEARQPNNYVVLQDLGIVYGDPRYDSRNRRIAVATRYFERSRAIKPDDYFAHQSLAVLAVRQGYAWGVDLAEEPFKSEAAARAKDSLKHRPGNGTVFIAQAQLAGLSWAAEADAAKKQVLEASFNAAMANARTVAANPTRVLAADLQWGLIKLRAANADDKPQNPPGGAGGNAAPVPATPSAAPGATPSPPAEANKGKFSYAKHYYLLELARAKEEAMKIPGWEAGQLGRVIDNVAATVEASTSDRREKLIWPRAPIAPKPAP